MSSTEQQDSNATTTFQHGKPIDDMCCLVTMEDITEEDGNYGKTFVRLLTFFPLSAILMNL
jgi:hypothetical protein